MRFQGLFTPLLRVLFTFPLRYWFAIGLSVVFRLGGWCRQIQTGFLQPRPTQDTARYNTTFAYRTITPFGRSFQTVQLTMLSPHRSPTTPVSTLTGLASSDFARHYSRNHYCFLFLSLLRCFSSGGSRLFLQTSSAWVAPFGHSRIIDRLHLPVNFRSLPRPSSPLRAKASPARPYSLPILRHIALLFAFTLSASSSLLFLSASMSMNSFISKALLEELCNNHFLFVWGCKGNISSSD